MSSKRRELELVPAVEPGVPAPKGPVINAAWIIRHYHTDPDTKKALVSEKWVRENVPGKRRLSYNVVGWFMNEVIAHYEQIRTQP